LRIHKLYLKEFSVVCLFFAYEPFEFHFLYLSLILFLFNLFKQDTLPISKTEADVPIENSELSIATDIDESLNISVASNDKHDDNDDSIVVEDDESELEAWEKALIERKQKKGELKKKMNEEKPEISDNDEF